MSNLRKISFDPLRIGPYVAPTHARHRADIDATAALSWRDPYDYVIFEAEPKSCSSRLDAPSGRLSCDNIPFQSARYGKCTLKRLLRRSLEGQWAKSWIACALLRRELRTAV